LLALRVEQVFDLLLLVRSFELFDGVVAGAQKRFHRAPVALDGVLIVGDLFVFLNFFNNVAVK